MCFVLQDLAESLSEFDIDDDGILSAEEIQLSFTSIDYIITNHKQQNLGTNEEKVYWQGLKFVVHVGQQIVKIVFSDLFVYYPLSYFSFQPVLHDWCTKGCGMCYPVCGMVHIKEPLLLIDKSSLCGSSGFPFSLSEWSLTICLTPYNRR